MKMSKYLFNGIALSAISLLPFSGLYAEEEQATENSDEVQLETITVTAQRRPENLQDVPLAITNMSGEYLEEAGITAVDEVSMRTPGFSMTRFNKMQPQLNIRGISSTDDSAYGDQSVGIFIDEVYIGRAGASDFNLMDLERVEVLRGPQGTLYGKNVAGGAVNIITTKPSSDTYGKASFSAGNLSSYEFKGLLNGALSDNVNGKLTLSKSERDGHSRSSIDGSTLGDEDNISVRGQLLFTTENDTEILLTSDYSFDDAGGNSRDCFGQQFVFFPWFAPGAPHGASVCSDDPRVNEKTVNGYQDREIWGVSAKVTMDMFDVGNFTSITAYRDSRFDYQEDFDGSDANLVINNVDEKAHQFSQEFRISNQSEDEKLNWVAGLYYFTETVDRKDNNDFRGNDLAVFNTPYPDPNFPFPGANLVWAQILPALGQVGWGVAPFNIFWDQYNVTKSYAAFFQGSYDLTEQLSLTLGGRYTRESKDAVINGHGFDPTGGFLAETYDVSPSRDWNSFTPKVSLDYNITDDVMIYASYSEGFKSGGFNGSAASEAAALAGYNPEEAKQWEIGMKSMFMDNRVRLNISAFDIDYTDIQIFKLVNGSTLVIENAADAVSKGFEAELTAAVSDTLTLNINYAYLDATYENYITDKGADLSGNSLPNAPENSYNIGFSNVNNVGDWGRLTIAGNYSYRDEVYFDAANAHMSDGTIWIGDDDRGLVDFHISLEFLNSGLELKLWGKNLSDELYRVHGISGAGPFGISENAAVVYGMPRTYGATLTWEFY